MEFLKNRSINQFRFSSFACVLFFVAGLLRFDINATNSIEQSLTPTITTTSTPNPIYDVEIVPTESGRDFMYKKDIDGDESNGWFLNITINGEPMDRFFLRNPNYKFVISRLDPIEIAKTPTVTRTMTAVPVQKYYTVIDKDTCFSIAKRLRMSVDSLVLYNNLRCNELRPGQKIALPPSTPTPRPTKKPTPILTPTKKPTRMVRTEYTALEYLNDGIRFPPGTCGSCYLTLREIAKPNNMIFTIRIEVGRGGRRATPHVEIRGRFNH